MVVPLAESPRTVNDVCVLKLIKPQKTSLRRVRMLELLQTLLKIILEIFETVPPTGVQILWIFSVTFGFV